MIWKRLFGQMCIKKSFEVSVQRHFLVIWFLVQSSSQKSLKRHFRNFPLTPPSPLNSFCVLSISYYKGRTFGKKVPIVGVDLWNFFLSLQNLCCSWPQSFLYRVSQHLKWPKLISQAVLAIFPLLWLYWLLFKNLAILAIFSLVLFGTPCIL